MAAEEMDKQEKDMTETDMDVEEKETPGQEAEASAEPSAGDGEKNAKSDKKERKRKDKKQDALKEKVEELEDRVKRQMAEFENFRKRTEKEKTAMFETGAKSVIEKMLPVVDNFERGLASVPEEEKDGAIAQGMQFRKAILTGTAWSDTAWWRWLSDEGRSPGSV